MKPQSPSSLRERTCKANYLFIGSVGKCWTKLSSFYELQPRLRHPKQPRLMVGGDTGGPPDADTETAKGNVLEE